MGAVGDSLIPNELYSVLWKVLIFSNNLHLFDQSLSYYNSIKRIAMVKV